MGPLLYDPKLITVHVAPSTTTYPICQFDRRCITQKGDWRQKRLSLIQKSPRWSTDLHFTVPLWNSAAQDRNFPHFAA